MARDKGNLIQWLTATERHVLPHKVKMMFSLGEVDFGQLEYRFGLIADEARTALAQVKKVQQIAKEKGYDDILAVLDEQIEFGHNIGKASSG
jgi:hypothetical protein